jgi:hydrogenase maturation factor
VMLPDAKIGDRVLVHSGYAIRTVPPQTAADAPIRPLTDH